MEERERKGGSEVNTRWQTRGVQGRLRENLFLLDGKEELII